MQWELRTTPHGELFFAFIAAPPQLGNREKSCVKAGKEAAARGGGGLGCRVKIALDEGRGGGF